MGWASFGLEAGDSEKLKVSGGVDRLIEVRRGEQTEILVEGDATLKRMPDKHEVVLVPGEDAGLNWQIDVGDDLSGVYIGDDACSLKLPTVRFDDGDEIELKECSAGG